MRSQMDPAGRSPRPDEIHAGPPKKAPIAAACAGRVAKLPVGREAKPQSLMAGVSHDKADSFH